MATGRWRDRFQWAVRGVPAREPGTSGDLIKPITYTEKDPDRRMLDVCVGNDLANPIPVSTTVNGPIKITGETVTALSAAYPTAANQVGRQAISIRNIGNFPVFIVNTVGITEAAADPDKWEIDSDETFNIDMNDSNKIILVAEAGRTVDIQIMEIRA